MSNEEGKKLGPERIALIVISVLLLIAVGYIVISSLLGNGEEAQPAPVVAGTAPPTAAEVAEEPKDAPIEEGEAPEAAATQTGPRRLAVEATPTPFHTTAEDDPRAILDLSEPDHFDYFDRPEEWYDYDSEGFGAYLVADSVLHGKDYNPEDNAVYWSYNSFQSGNTYAEISAINGDCIEKDAVGLVIRIDPNRTPSGYALEVSCDGEWRFQHHRQGKHPEPLIDWTASDVINTGMDAVNRLGIWGYQGKFYFFVNGYPVGEFWDSNYYDTYGHFGAYVLANRTFDLTAEFDDFAFWHIPFIP